MNSKKKNEIKAKHVLGELTLGDVLPLVEKAESLVIVNEEGDVADSTALWTNFDFLGGCLEVWRDWDDDGPAYKFPAFLKVKWRDDHMEILPAAGLGLEHSYKIFFQEHRPIKIKIL